MAFVMVYVIHGGSQDGGARMPEAFVAELEPVLPAEEPVGPEGGGPRVPQRAVFKVLSYMFKGFPSICARYVRLVTIRHARNEIAAAIICFRIAVRRGISLR